MTPNRFESLCHLYAVLAESESLGCINAVRYDYVRFILCRYLKGQSRRSCETFFWDPKHAKASVNDVVHHDNRCVLLYNKICSGGRIQVEDTVDICWGGISSEILFDISYVIAAFGTLAVFLMLTGA